jgi:cytochrome P450
MRQHLIPAIPKERRGLRLLMAVQKDPLAYFTQLMHQEGPYAWLKLNGQPLLMLNDATGIEHVLVQNASNYRKGRFNKVLRPLLGNGIFLSEGKIWRKQRQESAPVFANGNFNDMLAQMIGATEAMFQRWQPRIDQGIPIDITLEMMWFTLDVLLRALFHEARDGVAGGVQSALGLLLREAEGRIWSPFNLPQGLVLRLPKFKHAMNFLQDIVNGLITTRRANQAYPDDLLSRLIDHYNLSAQDQLYLRDQVMSFLLAGHETTAHGLAWSFYLLGSHPQHLKRMIAEADTVLEGSLPTLENIKQLTYTRQVFDEVLRLYPPVWTMSRETLGSDEIPLDDGRTISLPQGVVIMLCDYAVHRRETYWHHPDAFDPDRFDTETTAARPKFAWLPFGGGPRLCLGFRFAQIESIVALAMIVQRYSIALVPGQDVQPQPIITLRPNGPILLRIKNRVPFSPTGQIHVTPQSKAEGKCPFAHAAE